MQLLVFLIFVLEVSALPVRPRADSASSGGATTSDSQGSSGLSTFSSSIFSGLSSVFSQLQKDFPSFPFAPNSQASISQQNQQQTQPAQPPQPAQTTGPLNFVGYQPSGQPGAATGTQPTIRTITLTAGVPGTQPAATQPGTQQGTSQSSPAFQNTQPASQPNQPQTQPASVPQATAQATQYTQSQSTPNQASSSNAVPAPSASGQSSQTGQLKFVSSGDSDQTYNKLWTRFWDSSNSKWNSLDSRCQGPYDPPVVWEQAVIGRSVTHSKNSQQIEQTISNLMDYQNSALNAFSASTAKDNDVYTDDNSQVAWVFLEAYQVTQNPQYLQVAEGIVDYLQSQWASENGGVLWHYQSSYIASISTVESALAAMMLYDVNHNASLITFAQNCMDYTFKYLQDPSDHLIYDGVDSRTGTVNKGKLTYTVGVAMSVLVKLAKVTGNSYWTDQANTLATAAMNPNGAFYTSGYWNNQLKYVYLLFSGYTDLINSGAASQDYKTELQKQAAFIYTYLQDPNDLYLYFGLIADSSQQVFGDYKSAFPSSSATFSGGGENCSGTIQKSLINNAAAQQILQTMNVIT